MGPVSPLGAPGVVSHAQNVGSSASHKNAGLYPQRYCAADLLLTSAGTGGVGRSVGLHHPDEEQRVHDVRPDGAHTLAAQRPADDGLFQPFAVRGWRSPNSGSAGSTILTLTACCCNQRTRGSADRSAEPAGCDAACRFAEAGRASAGCCSRDPASASVETGLCADSTARRKAIGRTARDILIMKLHQRMSSAADGAAMSHAASAMDVYGVRAVGQLGKSGCILALMQQEVGDRLLEHLISWT